MRKKGNLKATIRYWEHMIEQTIVIAKMYGYSEPWVNAQIADYIQHITPCLEKLYEKDIREIREKENRINYHEQGVCEKQN